VVSLRRQVKSGAASASDGPDHRRDGAPDRRIAFQHPPDEYLSAALPVQRLLDVRPSDARRYRDSTDEPRASGPRNLDAHLVAHARADPWVRPGGRPWGGRAAVSV